MSGDITSLLDANKVVNELPLEEFTDKEKETVVGTSSRLMLGNDFDDMDPGWTFTKMFKNCTTLVDASELELPSTTLRVQCYERMFEGCTSLSAGPKMLPA